MGALTRTLAKLLSGPAAFLAIYWLSSGELPRNGQLVLATFLWAVVWWVLQPVPLAITSLLPLVMFPLLGVMNTRETAALYGQNIFLGYLGR